MSRELLKESLEALDDLQYRENTSKFDALIEKLKVELSKPEPEPVAWVTIDRSEHKRCQMVRLSQAILDEYELKQYPLYAEPVDQSAQIAELEKQLAELQAIRSKCTLVPTDKLEDMQRRLNERKPIGYIPQHSAATIKRDGMWDACTLYRTKVNPTDVEVFL